jgi:hypothetical protein
MHHEGGLVRATCARCIAHLVRRFPLGDQLISELRGRAAPNPASPPVNAAVAGRKLGKPRVRCRVLEMTIFAALGLNLPALLGSPLVQGADDELWAVMKVGQAPARRVRQAVFFSAPT